ncbi:hypothetical protein BGZ54_006649 [Gamsiella multidivaricata]|nr:hypothetical protein BGZ54_006649 [Gamsiella multidivaricata]
MESRSRSAGNGLLPARYPSTAVPSSQPGVSAIPTNLNLQQWRAPRTRSASSNVLTEGMRAQPPQYPHQSPSQYQNQYQYTGPPPASVYGGSSRLRSTSSNGSSNNSYSNNNNNSNNNISGSGANGQGAQSSRHGGGISSRGPPQTLMEIYAQQQQMQHQYSNQRAQLSQVQIQQMYGMRNSRSAPAFSKEQPSLDQHRQHRDTLQDQQHHQQQQQQQQQHQQHQQQQQMAKPPAGPLSPSSSDQVTVMFESTSFSVQDPNALVSAAVNDGDLSRRLSEEQGQ